MTRRRCYKRELRLADEPSIVNGTRKGQVVGESEPGGQQKEKKRTMTIDGKSPNVQNVDDTSTHSNDGSSMTVSGACCAVGVRKFIIKRSTTWSSSVQLGSREAGGW